MVLDPGFAPDRMNDVIFWTVLAILVLVNSLYETRHGRARILTRTRTWRESAGLVFRTIGTFCVICVLWSFWSCESVADWVLMVRSAWTPPPWTSSSGRAWRGGAGCRGRQRRFTSSERGGAPRINGRASGSLRRPC